MNRNLIIFLCTFVAGSLVALVVRSAMHDPYAAPPAVAAPATATDRTPVNTVCAICGMKVNPAIPTAEYQGKVIGFGCKQCPPKFAADPERYGPAYLANKVLE